MPCIIVFDVNETLLDLKALDPRFERVFGAAAVRREWFKQVLQSALVTTILDAYSDFGAVGAAALEMTAAVHDVHLTETDRKAILGPMRELPPHPEVPDSLRRLQEAGLRLCALTNSTRVGRRGRRADPGDRSAAVGSVAAANLGSSGQGCQAVARGGLTWTRASIWS